MSVYYCIYEFISALRADINSIRGLPSAHNRNPMASRSPTDLVLTFWKRLGDHMVVFLVAIMPYLLCFRSLANLHGLKEAPVVL